MTKAYAVVEKAGYEGQTVVRVFPAYMAAVKYLRRQYREDERDSLHVAVAIIRNGQLSYDY